MTWKTCPEHGPDNPRVWGCPECVREARQALRQIADIAEGSTTANSLQHIAKIAREAVGRPANESGDSK